MPANDWGQHDDPDMQVWIEFRESGLLWWINRSLHLFGWTIVVQTDICGEVTSVYPERTGWTGFSREMEQTGFELMDRFIVDPEAAQETPSGVCEAC